MGDKLAFMKRNGIRELSSAIDNKLRNAIAHMEIQVKESEISIQGRLALEVIVENTGHLILALTHVEDLLEKLANDTGVIEGSARNYK